jgi:hypothetical protein
MNGKPKFTGPLALPVVWLMAAGERKMRASLQCGMLLAVLAGANAIPALAQSFAFDTFADSTILTTQYAGATFANAIVLGAGITLNEFEFPPHSSSNVLSDNGGPIALSFTSPISNFSGYFTYSVPLTVQALDASNNVLASASSAYSNNEGLSGASGSHANESVQVSASGIYKIVITGGAQGTSFTADDITVITRCDPNQTGVTTVADAQALVNQALGVAAPVNDLNGDGVVNAVDVQIVINSALQLGCSAN